MFAWDPHHFAEIQILRLVLTAAPWITAITEGHAAVGLTLMDYNFWLVYELGNST